MLPKFSEKGKTESQFKTTNFAFIFKAQKHDILACLLEIWWIDLIAMVLIWASVKNYDGFLTTRCFYLLAAVCDNIWNLNNTKSNFFSNTKIFDTESDIFFLYQFLAKPDQQLFQCKFFLISNSIPCLIPNVFDTDSNSFLIQFFWHHSKIWKSFKTEKFRNRNVTLCLGDWPIISRIITWWSSFFGNLSDTFKAGINLFLGKKTTHNLHRQRRQTNKNAKIR